MTDLIHHTITGSGRPLVLIHGWAMHAGVWQGFSEELAEHCMTVSLDLRGHGSSRSLEGPYSFEQQARDVAALIEHLQIADAVLAGWSMGVAIILKMLALGICRAPSLVLISGNPSLVSRDGYQSGLAPAVVKRLYRQVQRAYPAGMQAFLDLLCTPEEHDRLSTDPAYCAAMDSAQRPDRTAALDALACLEREDLRPHLALIAVPTLIVHGERDGICPGAAARFMHAGIPRSRLLMLPDTGHMPFVSRRERVVEEMKDFLGMQQHAGHD
jgi:pimeloyl-[acyl-carrier protein] methyl ester esterase